MPSYSLFVIFVVDIAAAIAITRKVDFSSRIFGIQRLAIIEGVVVATIWLGSAS
jgi:hypothetical protein